MSLIAILVIVALVGVVMWAVNTQVRIIQQPYIGIINAIVIIVLVIWIARQFGVFGGRVHVPRWR